MMISNNHSLSMLLAGMLADPSILDEKVVTGISQDSREVKAGDVFLLLAKESLQRQSHLAQALNAGANSILFEKNQALTIQELQLLKQKNVSAYPVNSLRGKASEIAARFYGHPSLALTIIAVTGTNGKTSVAHFIAQALEFLGKPCGMMGTLGVGRVNALVATGMTTPDPILIQKTLADFCQQGIDYVVMEASSHALVQGRLESVAVDVAVLTNISRDHLDYHGSMVDYSAAKQHLFKFSSIKFAIVNSVDELGQQLISMLVQQSKIKVLSYSSDEDVSAKLKAKKSMLTPEGLRFDFDSDVGSSIINSTLFGRFNSDNLLAAIGSLMAVGIDLDQALKAIKQCHAVEGRMQLIANQHQANIVVDFAHTPAALKQALTSLRSHYSADEKIWCVFGCGGDKDSGKRAEMGKIVEHYADQVIVTDDNPRNEEPQHITDEILSGMNMPENCIIQHDRAEAIAYAIHHAKPNDIVLIAGKGHEMYQEINGVKSPFNDVDVVMKLLTVANDEAALVKGSQ